MEGYSHIKHPLPLEHTEQGSSSSKIPRTINKIPKNEKSCIKIDRTEGIIFQESILKKLDKELEDESDNLTKSCEILKTKFKDLQNITTTEKVPIQISNRYKTRLKRLNNLKKDTNDRRNHTKELQKSPVVTIRIKNKVDLSIKKTNELITKIKKEKISVETTIEDVKNYIERQEKNQRTKIKRQTANGDEFQRLLQVLLRQRAMSCPGAQIGIEVSGVGQLDDAVYLKTTENKCRFFQMKHMTKKLQLPVTAKELFLKHEFEDDDKLADEGSKNDDNKVNPCLNATQTQRKKESKQSGLHLLKYFKSFCIIKENSNFEHCNIEEVTLITNRDIVRTDRIQGQELMSLLIEKKGDSVIDECLDLESGRAQKYGLNVTEAKGHFFSFLLNESNKYLSKKKDLARAIIDEFLEKIHIVVNYPDLDKLKKLILNEVFDENIFHSLDKEMLGKCIFYTEFELLQVNHEFTTNTQWQSKINKIKKFVNGIKSVGLTNLKTKILLSEKSLTFENIDDISRDVKLFIAGDKHRVLECMGDNFNMNSIKIIHILHRVTQAKFLFCEYDHLLAADFLQDSFFSGDYGPLVIMCKKITDKEEVLWNKLIEALEKSKMIIVSDGINPFTSFLKGSLKDDKYLFKQYEHGYKYLTPSCKEILCKKQINFQMQPIQFDRLVCEELANNTVDDSCLWDILSNSNQQITVSDDSSFCSHGYSEDYYIPRKFHKSAYDELSKCSTKGTTTVKEESLWEGPSNDSKRIVIVVGDSGVGKSTTLTRAANKIREKWSNTWVARVTLRETFILRILKNISKLNSPDDAISCVSGMIFTSKPQNLLDKNLIKEALKSSYKDKFRFVLLLDGFNEINADLQNKVIALTKTLSDKCNVDQIWITTQEHEINKLQTELKVPSYFLIPLNEKDQISLMARYWKTQYALKDPAVEINYDELTSDAKQAITEFKSHLNGIEQEMFTANSLNLQMLADVLITDRKINEKLKIFDLYEIFVKQKFLVHKRETTLIQSTLRIGEKAKIGERHQEETESLDSLKDKIFENYIRGILQQFSVITVLNSTKTDKEYKKNYPEWMHMINLKI